MDKKERFSAAFEHLRHIGVIKTQTDAAKIMGSTSQNIGRALSGNPKVLTDKFLLRFITAFPDIFSMSWLITGDGSMLLSGSTAAHNKQEPYHARIEESEVAAESLPLSDRDYLVSTYTMLAHLADTIRDFQRLTDARLREIEHRLSILPNVSPQEGEKSNPTPKNTNNQ